jgi:hypothetical protein
LWARIGVVVPAPPSSDPTIAELRATLQRIDAKLDRPLVGTFDANTQGIRLTPEGST